MRILGIASLLGIFSVLALSGSDTGAPSVVPEPSLVALVTTGLAGIGVAAWRRNRKR